MALEKAVSEHRVGALVKIQAWRREGCAIWLTQQWFSHHLVLCAGANQVTLVRREQNRALIQCIRVDPARPSGRNELALRVHLNAGLLCVQLPPPRDRSSPIWKGLRFQECILNNVPFSSCLPGRGAAQQHPRERLLWQLGGGPTSREIRNLIFSWFSVNFH